MCLQAVLSGAYWPACFFAARTITPTERAPSACACLRDAELHSVTYASLTHHSYVIYHSSATHMLTEFEEDGEEDEDDVFEDGKVRVISMFSICFLSGFL